MSAIGELIILIIYAILSLAVLISAIKLFKSEAKKPKIVWGIVLLFFGVLLTSFAYSQYANHRNAELEKVGTYHLTQYPNCPDCILILKENNSYEIMDRQNILDQGNWEYKSGGDYWITEIGETGQLGNDIYSYDEKE